MNECLVYGTIKRSIFLVVKDEEDLTRVPEITKKELEPFQHFKTLDLDRGPLKPACEKRIANDFSKNGFSVVKWQMEWLEPMGASDIYIPSID